ncbi:DNA alkylation repair protein [Rhodobacteraceae bacterium KMS-5]|uniref:DNA alkylation repair protein n=1 Tax=Tabrizicola oligotrophica TaxID=2710650 RepID=A0A6M0QRH1_9RHOB|nr:DNA alkylation repair protein [Tabrizicola oligotrophica]NEY89253.1 DNA alkylation repair protein [Tabrizicola oligotrophica]
MSVPVEQALAALEALADPAKAADMAAYHKSTRRFYGVSVPQIDDLTDQWRAGCTLEDRLALAAALWAADIHETRIAAAKLLTQARIRPDDEGAWVLIQSWLPDFDGWAIADHAMIAGQKRLVWQPDRIATVEGWTQSPQMWTRRAAMVITLPFAKKNNPKPEETAIRERVLGWAASYATDPDWFIQKSVAWWLRDLSKHDAARVRLWLEEHGAKLKNFARKEAAKYL